MMLQVSDHPAIELYRVVVWARGSGLMECSGCGFDRVWWAGDLFELQIGRERKVKIGRERRRN